MEVHTVETPQLGDRSYVVHDGDMGLVIDPQRDLDRVLAEVQRARIQVTHVLETHIHNDYVTGGWDLARRLGARYAVAAADEVSFECLPLEDDHEILTGSLLLRAVHTPGHTHHHLSYVVSDQQGAQAVFTGGSLLFGTVGRTDLISDEETEVLARHQYRSAHRLAKRLPESASVYPTHGFGSFCASGASDGRTRSTMGAERGGNIALTAHDEDAFVETLLAGFSPYPTYYAYMAPINRAGGAAWDVQSPRRLEPREVGEQIAADEWVIDLRPRTAFARAHIPGTVSVEYGIQFATYVGWLRPWRDPVTLVGADRDQLEQAQRDISRIGIDDLHGVSADSIDTLIGRRRPGSYPVTDFADLAAQRPDNNRVVLDVRQRGEWNQSHLPAALHIPIQEIVERRTDVPPGQVWVHCGSGYRASIAASLLACAGRDVVLIDDLWTNSSDAGLTVTHEYAAGPASKVDTEGSRCAADRGTTPFTSINGPV